MIVAGLFNLKINGTLMNAKVISHITMAGIKNEAQLGGNGDVISKTSARFP